MAMEFTKVQKEFVKDFPGDKEHVQMPRKLSMPLNNSKNYDDLTVQWMFGSYGLKFKHSAFEGYKSKKLIFKDPDKAVQAAIDINEKFEGKLTDELIKEFGFELKAGEQKANAITPTVENKMTKEKKSNKDVKDDSKKKLKEQKKADRKAAKLEKKEARKKAKEEKKAAKLAKKEAKKASKKEKPKTDNKKAISKLKDNIKELKKVYKAKVKEVKAEIKKLKKG